MRVMSVGGSGHENSEIMEMNIVVEEVEKSVIGGSSSTSTIPLYLKTRHNLQGR